MCKEHKRRIYFEVLDELSEQESNEIFKFLSDLIPLEEDKANEIAMLWIRIENAEKENERMTHEMDKLHDKITELTKSNDTLKLNLKETEAKYQELVSKRGNEVKWS